MPRRTGQGRGEEAASERRIEAAQRRAKALELRKAGATYDQIAQQLGFSNRGNAQRAVMTALKEVTADPARDVLNLELERLDTMLLGLWQKARQGDVTAIDRVLKIQERRARYLGLDTAGGGMGAVGVESLLEVVAEGLGSAPRRHPAEVLLDCVHTADVLLVAARRQVEAGDLAPGSLEGLKVALEYAARWAEKTVSLDIASREQQVFEQVAGTYTRLLERVLDALELPSGERARAAEVAQRELRALAGGVA